MTRITESQLASSLKNYTSMHRATINKLNDDISSGIRVRDPGDSNVAGTISLMQQSIGKVDGYSNTIATTKSALDFQDSVLSQASDILVRAKEIATQGSNETLSAADRASLAAEVMQIRDHMVNLANSQYQGKFVYNGVNNATQPYAKATPAYTNPSTGLANDRYTYDSSTAGTTGSSALRNINLTDNLTLTVNTPGNQVFDNAIQGLEKLGRSLSGYTTTTTAGAPDGGGVAYTASQYAAQTADIKSAMDQLDSARKNDIGIEQTDLAGRLHRLDTAKSLVDLTKTSSQTALDTMQNTDVYTAATDLSQAQTALQASLTVSTKVLKMTILDYL